MIISMCNAPLLYDSVLAVFGDHTVVPECPGSSNATQLICDDDYCPDSSTGSGVQATVVVGAGYIIRVGGWSSDGTDEQAAQGVSELDIGFLCDPAPPYPLELPVQPVHQARKHRYLTIDADTNDTFAVALEVTLTSMKRCSGDLSRACRVDGDCSGGATGPCIEHPSVPAVLGYVQAPYTVASGCSPNACGPTDIIARVDATPAFRVWTENTLHIGDCEITPIATYELRATTDGVSFSDPLTIATVGLPEISPSYFGGFGDVAEAPIAGQYQPPGGIANITDIQAYVNTVVNYPTIDPTKPWAHRTWIDIVGLGTGTPPQYIPNASDLLSILQGLQDAKWLANANNRYPGDCPPNCGDGYCDTDAGEDNAACPADCP